LRVALGVSAAFSLCLGACTPSPEADLEQTLDLRNSGIQIRCGDAKATALTVIRGHREDRYGFLQRNPDVCQLEIGVPKRTRLAFGVALERNTSRGPHSARAAIAAEVKGTLHTLFETELGAGARTVTDEVELPPGRVTLTLSAAAGSRDGAAAPIAWTGLILRTRDPTFEGAFPWTIDAGRALAPYFEQTSSRPPTPGKRRLLIIGIDGANWELMQRLLEAGEMPALASLQKDGAWGILQSTVVPESAMSWTAMRTGVGPGRNGVYTFFSMDTPRRSFWHLLGDRGLRTVIAAVPKASPTRPLSGVFFGGWTLQRRAQFASPPELKPYLLRAGYDPSLANLRNVGYFTQRMSRRTGVARELLTNADWDLAFVVYEYSDNVAHRFGLFSDEWDAIYRAVDAEIAALLEATDEHTTLMLVSDHGWKSYPRWVNMNAWLAQSGFAEWKANLPNSGNVTGISAADTPNGATPANGRGTGNQELERMQRELLDLTDPQTGEKVVERVRASEAIFEGPYADAAPGRLLVEFRNDYRVIKGKRRLKVFGTKPKQHHSHEGIYLLAGPGIQPGRGTPMSIFDVAPTVLRFFGIEAPDDAEGRPMHDFGIDAPLAAPGPSYFAGARTKPPAHPPEVSPELEEGLRALGYIE
jgi:predicted AlkP superfamily phosphohydrolase/phosphomutase